MDIKTPSSTEEKQNRYENLSLLQSKDQLKFVIASRSDFDWSCELLKTTK
jgi:7-carboxy-7-deazaguanine synthase